MNKLPLRRIAAVLCGFVLLPGVLTLCVFVPLRKLHDRPASGELQVSALFKRVEQVNGKVLLAPAPPSKLPFVPVELYVLSKQSTGYWRKPVVAGTGFTFGYFDGSQHHTYKIIDVQSDDAMLGYDYQNAPAPSLGQKYDEMVKLHWK